jgi:UDP-N-acetylmuramoyl-tripeptide--D-alanyl-D-alanine ligase
VSPDAAGALFEAGEIARAVQGDLVASTPPRPVLGVAIDSRKAGPDCLFVPLAGSKADGHDYLEQALGAGASAALVARRVWSRRGDALRAIACRGGAALVVVEDTLRALQALAAFHLRRLQGLTTIGITGSNGKTTTKELVGAVLGRSRPTAVSPGNLNSETGLPLSCFLVRAGAEIGVFEMAMNHLGEIADLAEIVRPDAALITNIGIAHIGFCGSQEAIAREKKQVFRRFTGREVAFLPATDRFYGFLGEGIRGRVVPFGPGSTRGYEKSEDRGLDGSVIHWEGLRIRLPLVGRHNVSNALAAISVAAEFGVPSAEVREALEAARPLPGRSEIIRGRVTVVSDCYNSSPDSVRELLGLLEAVPRRERRIGVFGSMLELGTETAREHRWLGTAAAAAAFDALCFFGAEAREAYDAARLARPEVPAAWTEDQAALEGWLAIEARDGDLVVLKGSRGVALERALPALLAGRGGGACS